MSDPISSQSKASDKKWAVKAEIQSCVKVWFSLKGSHVVLLCHYRVILQNAMQPI